MNAYLVPYLGEASQGHTRPGQLRVFAAQWSDKASHARSAPERFALTEPLPFRKGSISRTLSHELGHILGLAHPARTQGVTGLLMGGAQAGYGLTPAEIETARATAMAIVQGRARTRRKR